MVDLEADRDKVRELLVVAPTQVTTGGAEPAEAQLITNAWAQQGRAVELLLPLTHDHEDLSVRMGAASLLTDLGYVDLAAPVVDTLTRVESEPAG